MTGRGQHVSKQQQEWEQETKPPADSAGSPVALPRNAQQLPTRPQLQLLQRVPLDPEAFMNMCWCLQR